MATKTVNWGTSGVYGVNISNISQAKNDGWIGPNVTSSTAERRNIYIDLDAVFGSGFDPSKITEMTSNITLYNANYSASSATIYTLKSNSTGITWNKSIVTNSEAPGKGVQKSFTKTFSPPPYAERDYYIVTYNGKRCIGFEVRTYGNGPYRTGSVLTVSGFSLTFTYTPTTYAITASAGTGGSISPSSATVEQGSSQTFTISPNTGYNISDVKVDGTSQGAISSYTFSNVTAAHTISATFAKKTYKITTTAGTGGSISPSNPNVEHGTNKAFTITANTGYQISDVKVDGTSVGAVSSYTFSNVTATHTIAATFALKTYTITATAGSHGSISPASASVTHGGSQTFTITPATGYNIEDVKVDGVSVGAVSSYQFTNVTAAHTISATFVSAQTRPYITGVSMTYNQTQISENNKVPAGQGYIIRVEVIEQ